MKPTADVKINGHIISAEADSVRIGSLAASENMCCCLCCCTDTGGI